MASVTTQPIRAQVIIAGRTFVTPDVVSFNVRRARGQMCATCTASVKVSSSTSLGSFTAGDIAVKAGAHGSLKPIFTGIVYKASLSPIRTDASKIMLNISAKDVLCVMEGQKINRRIRTYKDGSKPPERWGVVTAITRDNSPMRSGFASKPTSNVVQSLHNLTPEEIVYVKAAHAAEIDRAVPPPPSLITGFIITKEEATSTE